MSPCEFICGLMCHNTDALGFIPRPAIQQRWIHNGNYILQTNRFGAPVGYLLHGPVHPNGAIYINQACIEIDRRNRKFGQQAVKTLIERARKHNATHILLRCASDLQAVEFWISCGFLPIAIAPGGARRQRTIIQFEMRILNPEEKLDSARPRAGLRPNA